MNKLLYGFIAIVFIIGLTACQTSSDTAATSSNDDRTQSCLVPHPAVVMDLTVNTIYVAPFRLAWQELADDVVHDPILLEGNPVVAELLNQQFSPEFSLDRDTYLAEAGFLNDGIVDRINADLSNRFPETPLVSFDSSLPNTIIAYAYLEKKLVFDPAFEGRHTIDFGSDEFSTVKAFGFKNNSGNREMRKNVHVLFSNYSDIGEIEEFAVSIKAGKDELILARVDPKPSLGETYEHFKELANRSASHTVDLNSTFLVPIVDFDISQDFESLINRRILNFTDHVISVVEASQSVSFLMDEHGTRIQSSARFRAAESEPISYVFDQPFLVAMREGSDSEPYALI